jgi:hypothetical protein
VRRYNSRAKCKKGGVKMAKKQITVPVITLTGKSGIVAGVIVALLLLVIGAATGTEGVAYAGIFILPLVLFCGGLLSTKEPTPVRVTLLVLGGVLLLAVALTSVMGAAVVGMF